MTTEDRIELPSFTVGQMSRIFDDELEETLQAGLIALALRRDIEDVLEEPWSEWIVPDEETGEKGHWGDRYLRRLLPRNQAPILGWRLAYPE